VTAACLAEQGHEVAGVDVVPEKVDAIMRGESPIVEELIGELIDATGSLQACAPAADNFETFYAGTTAPSLSVDVLGANHMSFIEDVGSCGLPCSFCNAATAPQEEVLALSRAFVVAFYERYLKGHVGYDTYLTGAEAVARYVDTGQATIASK